MWPIVLPVAVTRWADLVYLLNSPPSATSSRQTTLQPESPPTSTPATSDFPLKHILSDDKLRTSPAPPPQPPDSLANPLPHRPRVRPPSEPAAPDRAPQGRPALVRAVARADAGERGRARVPHGPHAVSDLSGVGGGRWGGTVAIGTLATWQASGWCRRRQGIM